MGSGRNARGWRILVGAVALLLILGLAPGFTRPAAVSAQSDELTQREFDNLIDDAQADDPVFGPEDGELELDPERVAFASTDLEIDDFLATVTFQNPYAGSRQQFDYGIQFRAFTDNGDTHFLRFIAVSDGTWGLTDGTDDLVDTGTYDDLDDTRRGENTLTVYAEGNTVHLGINGDYVSTADVDITDPGEIAAGAAFLSDSYLEGAATGYSGFTVWELQANARPRRTPTPSDEETPAPEGITYESPTYGYSVTYDDTWEVAAETSRRQVDTLELDNGLSNLQFISSETTETPVECVDNMIDNLQSDNSFADVTIALDDNDEEMQGEGDDGSAFVVLQLTLELSGAKTDLTMYFSCIPIVEGESMLSVTHASLSDDYNDEIENRTAVLDTLDLGNGSISDRDNPDVEPTAEDTSDNPLPEGSITFYLEATEAGGPIVIGTLVPNRDATDVSALIFGAESDSSEFEVTINDGTCRRPGDVAYEVGTSSESGLLEETVDAPLDELSSGDYIMIISEDGTPDTAVACGELIQMEP
jgi:hypothetical protein